MGSHSKLNPIELDPVEPELGREKNLNPPFVERVVRTNLAAVYQILALQKMDDLTYTHISARVPEEDSFFIYPFGMTFEEVTASSLLKVSLDGEVLEGTEHSYNKTGYMIHGNIYKNRPDVNTIIHLHTEASIAVSAMKEGLLPISQWALHFYDQVAYHSYDSLVLDHESGEGLVQDLGSKNVMFLRNHGILTCGKTPHEALFYIHHLELACRTQCMALAQSDKLIMPSKETCQKACSDLLSFEKDLGHRDWLAWIRRLKRENIQYDDWDVSPLG